MTTQDVNQILAIMKANYNYAFKNMSQEEKYHIFGFTGTPIFSVNAGAGGNPNLKTTEQAFGDKLHTYTIVDAINDGNVLPFRIDYINTVKQKDGEQDKQVTAIDTEEALASQGRISEVVKYILEHFGQKTMRNSYYSLKGQRVNGFNSMLAVSSIPVCKKYYLELKKQIAERHRDLTIATMVNSPWIVQSEYGGGKR